MTVAILAPYGSMSPEVGVVYLLALYLSKKGIDVEQIRCNGILSLCDRDVESNWRRSLECCFNCVHEQRALEAWSGISSQDISRLLSIPEVTEISRWSSTASLADPDSFQFRGINLEKIVETSFRRRFSGAHFDLNNKLHEKFYRALLSGAAKMVVAGYNYCQQKRPKALLVVDYDSFLVSGFLSANHSDNISKLAFRADLSNRAVQIREIGGEKIFNCPLILDDVVSQRNDPKTWPKELINILDGIVNYFSESIG